MKDETKFVRPDGTKIIVAVEFSQHRQEFDIENVFIIPKGKRNGEALFTHNDYHWRTLNMKHDGSAERYLMDKYLQVCTSDELLTAKLNCWQKKLDYINSIKPKI